jgi:Trk K+ transport system NAD-binding subunit
VAHRRGRIWRTIRNSPGIQISLYFIAFALLIGLYTIIVHSFYPLLENKTISWANALFFVVQSMTTVGNTELPHFGNSFMMLLSIQIILTGVIMIFIVVPLLVAPFVITLLAPTPPRKTPHALSGHVVVFGYDEIIRSMIDSLAISDHDIVIIEQDKAFALEIATNYRKRAYVIWGNYTDPNTWSGAHVVHAGHIIISKDERLTANIVLGIRDLAHGKIISVVDKLSFDRYLRYAGAEHVLSPKHTTGWILAHHAVITLSGNTAPEVPGLEQVRTNSRNHATHELRLINIPVIHGSNAEGKTLKDLQLYEKYGVVALFLRKKGNFIAWPAEEERIDITTSLFLFGTADAIGATVRDEFDSDGRRDALAVIAGFGDVGAAAYQELRGGGITCIVVDLKQQDVNQVIGNAEDEVVLRKAHIEQAQICIVALNSDNVNVFTTLMVRNLNPDIRILARANEPASVDKLYRAGADYVALLPTIGGQTITRIILADIITILLDLPNGEMVIVKDVTIQTPTRVSWFVRKTGVKIIGIESPDHSIVTPGPEETLTKGDVVVVAGNNEQLKKFIRLL